MSIKIGINGFGRIGRLGFRAAWDWEDIDIVQVNELKGGAELAGHLAEFDTVHGRWDKQIESGDGYFSIDGEKVSFTAHGNPADIPWSDYGVDIVVESSGAFRTPESIQPHFDNGAKKWSSQHP